MKIYINFSVLVGMLLFSSIAHGQNFYKKYIHQQAPFHIDTVFNKSEQIQKNVGTLNYIWLTSLNGQYIDTTKNKINAFAIPQYHEIKNRGLFGPHHVKKQMEAGLYYHPLFSYTNQYGSLTNNFIKNNGSYPTFPYGYSPYTIKATASPYYILPKF